MLKSAEAGFLLRCSPTSVYTGNHISIILDSIDMEEIFDARQEMALMDLRVMTGVFVKVCQE